VGRRYEVWGLHPTIRLPEFPPHLTILAVNTQQALRPARFVAGRQHAVIRCSFLVGAWHAVPGANAWQRRAIQAARPRPQPAAVNRSLWSAAARRRCLPLGLAQACCTRWHARDAFRPRREFRGSEPQLRKKEPRMPRAAPPQPLARVHGLPPFRGSELQLRQKNAARSAYHCAASIAASTRLSGRRSSYTLTTKT